MVLDIIDPRVCSVASILWPTGEVDYPLGTRFNTAMTERMGIERLSGLVAFAKAGSLGSFAAAARALSMTPSAVSKSIGRLEAQLGLTLLHRSTRALALTDDGRRIHAAALRLLEEADTIEQLASAARSQPAGLLRIAASFPIAVHWVAPMLPGFQARYPEIQVELRVADTVADMAGDGVDLAIRIGSLPDSSLKARKLAPHRLCCYASPAYLREHGQPSTPDDLTHHRTLNLRYQSSGSVFRWPFAQSGGIIEITPRAAILADASEALVAIALAGGGIAMCADFMVARHVTRGDLMPVLSGYAVTRENVTALWPATRRHNPAVRVFLDWLTQHPSTSE